MHLKKKNYNFLLLPVHLFLLFFIHELKFKIEEVIPRNISKSKLKGLLQILKKWTFFKKMNIYIYSLHITGFLSLLFDIHFFFLKRFIFFYIWRRPFILLLPMFLGIITLCVCVKKENGTWVCSDANHSSSAKNLF